MNATPSRKPTRPSVNLCLTWSTGTGVRPHPPNQRHFKGSGSRVFTPTSQHRVSPPLSVDSGGPLLRELDHGRESGRVLVVELEIRVVQDQLLDAGHDGPPEVDSRWEHDLPHELLPGHLVLDVIALHLADAVDFEGGDVFPVLPIDLRALRWQGLREGLRENLPHPTAVLPARDLLQGVHLRVRRRRIDVEPGGSSSLVDGLRPPKREGELHAVELRVPELPVADLVSDKRFAVPLVRISVEITRTAVRALAALDVFRLKTPFRGHDLSPRRSPASAEAYLMYFLPLPSRDRNGNVNSYPHAQSRAPWPRRCLPRFPTCYGASRFRWPPRSA